MSAPGPPGAQLAAGAAASARSWSAERRRRVARAAALAAAALAVLGVASITLGSVTLGVGEALGGLVSRDESFARTVVWEIRVPRYMDALLVGAALGVAGSLLQAVTRNPLADPTVMGISGAAGLATTFALVLWPAASTWGLVGAATAGGLLGAGAILAIAWHGAISPIRLTLAGVALSAFFGAGIVGLLASSRTFLELSLGFLAGGLYGSEWRELRVVAPLVLPGLAGAYLLSGRLNALELGDEVATGLGVAPDRTRLLALGLAGVLTGAAVAVAGLVSFVGLVSPHLARFAVGSDQRYRLVTSAVIGALLVGSADLVGRLVIRPAEIPMGIFTAAVGAPFLLYLLRYRA